MTTGMLMLSGGLVGLSQITVSSSYNAIWPFYVIMGAGLALTMPTTSATAMAAVDPQKAGVASGRDQLRAPGGRRGGPGGARRRRRDAGDQPVGRRACPALPAGVQDRAAGLNELVIGGQGRVVGRIAGPARPAERARGVRHRRPRGDVGRPPALTFAAALTAFIGLRGVRSPRSEEPSPAPAPTESAPVDRAPARSPG